MGALGTLGILGVFAVSALVSFLIFFPQSQAANFLILGISGPGHEGSTLTDSMVLATVKRQGIKTVSVPRDIWYTPYQTKINALYYYSLEKNLGIGMVKQAVTEITGQEINYWIVIDFNTFVKMVDWLGGIDVDVVRAFTDTRYPLAGRENDLCNGDKEYKCRYETISFSQGRQHLNGETALKFVRSRNAKGEEGTDSARSLRQEQVISALKTKILSPEIIHNPNRLREGWQIFLKGVQTDLNWEELFSLWKTLLSASRKNLESYVLDGWEEENGLLFHPKTHPSGQWVLLPRNNSWEKTHDFINCFLNQEGKPWCSPAGK